MNVKSIAIAAGIGAAALWLLQRNLSGLALGAGIGAATQIGVRLAGVS